MDIDDDRLFAGLISAETQQTLESALESTLSWTGFILKWGTLPVLAYIGLSGKANLMFSRSPTGPSTRVPELLDLLVLQEPLPAGLN